MQLLADTELDKRFITDDLTRYLVDFLKTIISSELRRFWIFYLYGIPVNGVLQNISPFSKYSYDPIPSPGCLKYI